MLKYLALSILLLTSQVEAEISPPEGARLVGSEPSVVLTWEGASKEYYLQVLASGRRHFEGAVQGNRFELRLAPNVFYTWSVVPGGRKGYQGRGQDHHFQYSNRLVYSFDGAEGAHGGKGHHGGPGQPGPDLNISLTPAGDFLSVKIEGPRQRVEFLLLPTSNPIWVSARGGQGGFGGPGEEGLGGYYNAQNYYVPAGNGGPGGNGGDGGKGGDITIRALAGDADRFLKLDVTGGVPGKGGPGGSGGRFTNYQQRANPNMDQMPTSNGQAGRPGNDGRPGAEGRIIYGTR